MILRWGIDSGIDMQDTTTSAQRRDRVPRVAAMAYLAARQQYIFINRAGEGFLRALRVRAFDHIQRQSLAFFDRIQVGCARSRA